MSKRNPTQPRKPLKQTEFKRKPEHKGFGARRKPMRDWRQKHEVGTRKPLGKGKKTKEWDGIRARELKPAFERVGITTCEARRPNCMIDNGLGFAHRLKRRHITTKAEMRRVVLLCNNCHDFYEFQGEEKMSVAFDEIIAARTTPIRLFS